MAKKVSVIVLSYNHERSIEKAIESVVSQQGDFELEVIVGDDSSSDNSLRIIESLSEKYGNIKVLSSKVNGGITQNFYKCLKESDGNYVAMCEGDDWYASPYKLKKQIEMLERCDDCVMCSNSFIEYNELKDTYKTIDYQQNFNGEIYTFEELVLDYKWSNFSTYIYKRSVIDKLPEIKLEEEGFDYGFNIRCAVYGNLAIIKEPLSFYRTGNGLWSGNDILRQEYMTLSYVKKCRENFKKLYDDKYDNVFERKIEKCNSNIKRAKRKIFKNKLRKIFGLKQK